MEKKAKIIAFYLPQFHPIPENDKWWGKGFTEWTNVAKAKPMFPGHYQPHVPADLGFYDLRVPETRMAQAEMAREYGIDAFCYYHYWFAGKRLIEKPFNEVLESGEPDFPFCLCWANQSWTGVWHGSPDKVLMEQTYPGTKDHEAHFYALLKALTDERYLTVDGKPIFVVYTPKAIPDAKKVTDLWRELAIKAGLPGMHLVGVSNNAPWDPEEYGFDASVTQRLPWLIKRFTWHDPMLKFYSFFKKNSLPTIYSYKELVHYFVRKEKPDYVDYPCLIPNWDNTPRSGSNGLVLHGSNPELFRIQVKIALSRIVNEPKEHRIIFLKAWNEWAEGNYMEPELKFGRGYLEALKQEVFDDNETR